MWETVKLGDVATVIAGQSPTGKNLNKEGLGMPFYQGKKDYGDKFLKRPTVWTKSVTKVAIEGDILMSVRAPVGALNIATEEICIGRGLAAIRVHAEINKDYLFYALAQISEGLTGSSGAIFNSINKKQIEDIEFLFPPLAEQQRIVAKLDAAFAEIDGATLETKKAIHQARLLSQKIIDDNVDSQLPDTDKIQLKNFCSIKHGYAFDGKSFSLSDDESKPIVLTPGNFSEDGTTKFTQKNTKRLHDKYDDSLLFSENNLVVVMTDLSSKMLLLGKPAFIKETNILHNQRIGLVQNNEQTILNEYLYFYFKSTKYLSAIKRTASGTMVRHTAPKRILDNYINAPKSLTSQRQVSDKISKSLFDIATLISVYEDKTSNLFALKSAILAQELQSEAA